MSRQTLNDKKIRAIARKTGLPVVAVLVRGGTDHRKDLCLEGGKVVHLYKDGTMEDSIIKHASKKRFEGEKT